MSQNLVSLTISDQQLTAVDQAMTSLESALAGLVSLTPDQRRGLPKMGDKSEAFCRQTVNVLSLNPQVLPPTIKVPEMKADLAALDRLRPVLVRMERLFERIADTEMALGSDLMSASLEGYAQLKLAGKSQGLDSLRQGLSARFGRSARVPEPATA